MRTRAVALIAGTLHTSGEATRRVVLLPAAGSSNASWPPGLVDLLQERGFDVLLVDLRDMGQSDHSRRGEPGYGVADLAEDVVGVIASVGWQGVVLFGVSLGAAVAGEAAGRLSRDGAAAVLVGPMQAEPIGRAAAALVPNAQAVLTRSAFGAAGLASVEVCVRYLVQYAASHSGSRFDSEAAAVAAASEHRHARDLVTRLTNLPAVAAATR